MAIADEPAVGRRLAYVCSRWRFAVTVVGSAVLLTLAVSEILPKRYTATATVIIEPPAGNDPRMSTAVNPTYLDSLRTFERFFTSDSLFQKAASRFHLDAGSAGISALKKRILKVVILHDTRILEVSATLPDPKMASVLVRYITENGIAANRNESVNGDRDTLENMTGVLEQARKRLDRAYAAYQSAEQEETPGALESEISAAADLSSELRRRQAEAEAEAAEWQVRAKDGAVADREYAEVQARGAAASANEYSRRDQQVREQMTNQRKLLAEVSVRRALTSSEMDAARKSFDSAEARVRDFTAMADMRGERLHIIDPGVIPSRPSSPRVLLNIIAAFLLAACFVAAWLSLTADKPRQIAEVVRASRRLA